MITRWSAISCRMKFSAIALFNCRFLFSRPSCSVTFGRISILVLVTMWQEFGAKRSIKQATHAHYNWRLTFSLFALFWHRRISIFPRSPESLSVAACTSLIDESACAASFYSTLRLVIQSHTEKKGSSPPIGLLLIHNWGSRPKDAREFSDWNMVLFDNRSNREREKLSPSSNIHEQRATRMPTPATLVFRLDWTEQRAEKILLLISIKYWNWIELLELLGITNSIQLERIQIHIRVLGTDSKRSGGVCESNMNEATKERERGMGLYMTVCSQCLIIFGLPSCFMALRAGVVTARNAKTSRNVFQRHEKS